MANEGAENEPESGEASSDKPSPGQRLAAAKAAKAARKAADRGRQAELTEQKALEQAAAAKDWIQEHIGTLLVGAAIVVVLTGALVAWSTLSSSRVSSAGALLVDAVQTANAEIDEGGTTDEESYPSAEARSTAAATRFERAIAEGEGTAVAAWAHLGKARVQYEQGETTQARAAYESALKESPNETVTWLALEGLAYTYEADEAFDDALSQLESLRSLGQDVAPIAEYHQGRMLLAQQKTDDAKAKFEAVLKSLQEPGAADLPHTKQQTEARLAVLEPGRPRAPSFDPDQLQQLLQLQQQQPSP